MENAELSAIPVVVNSSAGGRRSARSERLLRALAAEGIAARLHEVPAVEIDSALEREAAAHPPIIAVAGGDGTQVAAANHLAGTATALAPIPTGTLNHFARRWGLTDVASSARALREGRSVPVPLGVMDDRLFLNTAIFGFYADVVRRRERYRRWIGKWGGAAIAFGVTMMRPRPLDLTIVVEGERLERRTGLVWVGLGQGSFPLAHESPDRRTCPDLEVVLLRPGGLVSSARLLSRTLLRLWTRRSPVADPALEVLHARRLLIEARHPIGITLDGEVLRRAPPILIAVQDGAMRVVVAG